MCDVWILEDGPERVSSFFFPDMTEANKPADIFLQRQRKHSNKLMLSCSTSQNLTKGDMYLNLPMK